jgi:hypothetical protein
MEHFVDDLSKRLAKAVSRREMLSISSRTLFTAFVASTGIGKLWAHTIDEGRTGSSQCGAVQLAVQLGVGDYDATTYHTHREYIGDVRDRVATVRDARLISADCGTCIVRQFVDGVPVSQQTSCGTVVFPTLTCPGVSETQVEAAAVLAFSAAPDAFGDESQLVIWSNLTQEILGCPLDPTATSPAVVVPARLGSTLGVDPGSSCAAAGINYCGPGNSGNGTYLPPVAACLNDQCCVHDNCYSQVCEPTPCYFTPQTRACDAPLLATCLGHGSCSLSDFATGFTTAVCAVVICAVTTPTKLCKAVQLGRLLKNPECGKPCNGSCCPSGTDCETTTTAVPGAITGVCCVPGSTACGTTCCAPPGECIDGSCVTNTCQPGTTPCAGSCCPTGTTFCCVGSNGIGACCPSDTACCTNLLPSAQCVPPSDICCPYGDCPTGTTCCSAQTSPTSGANSCCTPGLTCCAVTGSGTTCCPGGFTCCGVPYVTNVWCCAPGTGCGSTWASCV